MVERLVVSNLFEIDLDARSHPLAGEHSVPFKGLGQAGTEEQAETPFAAFRLSGKNKEPRLLDRHAQIFDFPGREDQFLLAPLQLLRGPGREMPWGERDRFPSSGDGGEIEILLEDLAGDLEMSGRDAFRSEFNGGERSGFPVAHLLRRRQGLTANVRVRD
ncbi:MAG TPA: hypothetical protein VGH73_07780 [Thermoanaerobaculia bacterium]